MMGSNAIGTTRIGETAVARSGKFSPADLRVAIAGKADYDVTRVGAASKAFIHERSRILYPLDTENDAAAGDLEHILSAGDRTLVVLCGRDPNRIITVKNDDDPDPDVPDTFFAFGDFELREGNAIALEYNASHQRWYEVGRLDAHVAYDDGDETRYARIDHSHAATGNHDLLSSRHDDTEDVAFQRGALVVGDATQWTRLEKGADGKFLKSGADDISWEDVPGGDAFKTITGDSGSAVADAADDTLSIVGGEVIVTAASDGPEQVSVAMDVPNTAEDSAPDCNADYLASYDTSGSAHKKVQMRKVVPTAIFITNATGSGGSVITDENWEAGTDPANHVLTDFDTDGNAVVISVEVDAGPNAAVASGWQPTVTIRGADAPVTVTNFVQVADSRRFTGSATIALSSGSYTLYADSVDGGRSQSVAAERLSDPPISTNADWGQNGGGFSSQEYPTSAETGLQTAVKSGDEVYIQVTLDSSATRITITATGASSTTQHFDDTYGSGTHVVGPVTCGASSGTKQFTVQANRDGGAYGASDATANITMDQAAHSFSSLHNKVFSPVSNFALKSGDSCTGDVECTNWNASDVISYTSSEVTITASTTYVETKTYTYLSGTYRDSGSNVNITSRRKANGKQQTAKNYLIPICNAAATIQMNGATSRLRSRAVGGDKTYGLSITSNYDLKSVDIDRDAGAPVDDGPALGAWSEGANPSIWTNTITIQEDDAKNTAATVYTWGDNASLSVFTGSGIETTVIGTYPTYTVGGFEQRQVDFSAYDEYEAIGTMVTNKDNATKLAAEFVTGDGVYVHNWDDSTKYPTSKKYTITDSAGNYDADGNYVRCLDPDIYESGAPYWIKIAENA